MFVTDQDQRDAMQRCLDDWREAQLPSQPGLRQELAYRDGFADALHWLRASSEAAQDGSQGAALGMQRIHLHLDAD